MLLGVLLVANPGAGAIGITWAIGWLVFLFGTVELSLAWAIPSREPRAGRTNPHQHVTAPAAVS